ncbi:E3 ubiquitin-protein ligase UPL6-like [Rutidosis leptorrhynchoides]|uniref:E3 ubiquitin-protein ligase UPL6-like n=1 Tax=Rutidosis leptorrhynchoides TaxID=125765 RepID=UPI003A9A5AF5
MRRRTTNQQHDLENVINVEQQQLSSIPIGRDRKLRQFRKDDERNRDGLLHPFLKRHENALIARLQFLEQRETSARIHPGLCYFGPDSCTLLDLIKIIESRMEDLDHTALIATCRLLLLTLDDIGGDILKLFGVDYSCPDKSVVTRLVTFRVKNLVKALIQAAYDKRDQFRDKLQGNTVNSNVPTDELMDIDVLLKTTALLTDNSLPWSCQIVSYLFKEDVVIYKMLKDVVILGMGSSGERATRENEVETEDASLIETVLCQLLVHSGSSPCVCSNMVDQQFSFLSILTIPYVWSTFPRLKEIYVSAEIGMYKDHLKKIETCSERYKDVLLLNSANQYDYICLFGNLIVAGGVCSIRCNCSYNKYMHLIKCSHGDVDGRLLPILIFYHHLRAMVITVIRDDLGYCKSDQIHEIKSLVAILKKAFYEMIRFNDFAPMNFDSSTSLSKERIDYFNNLAKNANDRLQFWMNRSSFDHSSNTQVNYVDQRFIKEALDPLTRENFILTQIPFVLPFDTRVKIYNMKVTFDDEDGQDFGGLTKEFMELFTLKAFDKSSRLFEETEDHLLYPNPCAVTETEMKRLRILGAILAKVLVEHLALNIPFARFFLNDLIKNMRLRFGDLAFVDRKLYNKLEHLRSLDEIELEKADLTFTAKDDAYEDMTVDLIEDGNLIKVDKENLEDYLLQYAHHRLSYQVSKATRCFIEGFRKLIPRDMTDIFTLSELQYVISGEDTLDANDLQSNTNYWDDYNEEHEVIKMFWDIFKSFSLDNQRKLLVFATGRSRAPMLGFAHMDPKFCILKSDLGIDYLPTAGTCGGSLYLPPYESCDEMRKKLLAAITAGAGFDLSFFRLAFPSSSGFSAPSSQFFVLRPKKLE